MGERADIQFSICREEKPIDFQLPSVRRDFVYVPAAHIKPEAPVKRFKEKTITSLGQNDAIGVPDSFKKRKFAGKRNARQRLDDDD